MRKLTHMLLAGTLVLACSSCGVETTANYQVIPLLQKVALSQESPFNLNAGTIIAYPENNELLKRNAKFPARLIGLYRRDGLNYREPFRQQADLTVTEKK